LVRGRDQIEIRDAVTGGDVVPLARHPCAIDGISWSAAGNLIAVTSGWTTFLWDRQTAREVGRLDRARPLLAFSPEGNRCAFVQAAVGEESHVVVWDRPANQRLIEFEGLDPTVVLLADPSTLIVGNEIGQIGFYDLSSRKWTRILKKPEGSIRSLALSGCGRWMAAGSADGHVRAWQRDTGKLIQEIAVGPANQADSPATALQPLAFSADGKQLGWTTGSGEWLVWEVSTGRLLHRFQTKQPLAAWAVACSPTGRWMAAGSTADGEGNTSYKLWVWDVATGTQLLETPPVPNLVRPLTFAPDAQVLASGSWDRTVLLWDLGRF
jgi:WD40 repeat protein